MNTNETKQLLCMDLSGGSKTPPKKKYNKHFNTHRVISFKFPLP